MEVLDTLKEVTVVMVQLNETGDTVRTSTVTDRVRARNRDRVGVDRTKTVIRVDTVFVESRDSVATYRGTGGEKLSGRTTLHTTLKWVFAIVVALGGLVIINTLAWRKG